MATREQLQNDTDLLLHADVRIRAGQRLTLSNFVVTKLSFLIRKIGTPEDLPVTFTIRKVSDDSILGSKVLGNASTLQTTNTWEEVTFDSAIPVNEEVRIAAEYAGTTGYPTNGVVLRYMASDVVAAEYMDWFTASAWTGGSGGIYDSTYKITYTLGDAPTVTTQAVTDISGTTATGNGNITSIGDTPVTQHGHCWNTTGTPTTADSKTENGAGAVGAFTSAITGLVTGTKYYVRAYATNSGGTSYGGQVEFWADKGTVWPSEAITRITGLVHRYDRRKGIYQLEISMGDVTSVVSLPYRGSAKRATEEKQEAQDTAPVVEEAVKKAEATIEPKFIEAVKEAAALRTTTPQPTELTPRTQEIMQTPAYKAAEARRKGLEQGVEAVVTPYAIDVLKRNQEAATIHTEIVRLSNAAKAPGITDYARTVLTRKITQLQTQLKQIYASR